MRAVAAAAHLPVAAKVATHRPLMVVEVVDGRRRKQRAAGRSQGMRTAGSGQHAASALTSLSGARRLAACEAVGAGAHLHCFIEGVEAKLSTCSGGASSTHVLGRWRMYERCLRRRKGGPRLPQITLVEVNDHALRVPASTHNMAHASADFEVPDLRRGCAPRAEVRAACCTACGSWRKGHRKRGCGIV